VFCRLEGEVGRERHKPLGNILRDKTKESIFQIFNYRKATRSLTPSFC